MHAYEDSFGTLGLNSVGEKLDLARSPLHWNIFDAGTGNVSGRGEAPVILPADEAFGLVGIVEIARRVSCGKRQTAFSLLGCGGRDKESTGAPESQLRKHPKGSEEGGPEPERRETSRRVYLSLDGNAWMRKKDGRVTACEAGRMARANCLL